MSDKWKAIARSATGTSHLEREKPCQDYGAYKQWREYLIGAVSDGAGSRDLSEHGSKLAVEVTLKYLTEVLENSRRTNPFASQNGAEEIFRELISRVRDAISQEASDWNHKYNQQVSAGDFACTLLAFVSFPNGIAAMQLGDGFIVVRGYKDRDYDLLFQPNKGEYVNVTTFVTSPPEYLKRDLQVIYQPRRVSFVCASTDGLEKLALENNQAYARFFIPKEQYIQKAVNPEQDRDVEEFLNSDDVNKRTDDDKTILLCADIDADPAPQITAATPKSKPPAPLPPTTTRPPSIVRTTSHSLAATQPPIVKSAPKTNSSIPIDRNPPQSDTESEPEMDESLSDISKSSKKRKKKKPRILVGLFLFSNFLSVYFATVGAIYVIEKIHQNRPDLELRIVNQFSLGSIASWGTWAGIFVLCLYTIFTGLYASDDPNDPDNKNNRGSNKKGFLDLIIRFKPNIGEVFAFCLPLAAILFAFLTAFSLNNTFTVIPKTDIPKSEKTETKPPSSDKPNSDVIKPNSVEKPKSNKDAGSGSASNVDKPNSGEKAKDLNISNPKDPATTSDVEPKRQTEPKPPY